MTSENDCGRRLITNEDLGDASHYITHEEEKDRARPVCLHLHTRGDEHTQDALRSKPEINSESFPQEENS